MDTEALEAERFGATRKRGYQLRNQQQSKLAPKDEQNPLTLLTAPLSEVIKDPRMIAYHKERADNGAMDDLAFDVWSYYYEQRRKALERKR